jgi:hypothetical protein
MHQPQAPALHVCLKLLPDKVPEQARGVLAWSATACADFLLLVKAHASQQHHTSSATVCGARHEQHHNMLCLLVVRFLWAPRWLVQPEQQQLA